MATVRTKRSLANVAAGLSTEALLCRDLGHPWAPYTARYIPARRQYAERLVCARCKTVKDRLLDAKARPLASAYDYAEGYPIRGYGRLTAEDRAVLRLAGITQRLTNGDADVVPIRPRRRRRTG